ncbi:MAG: methyltransferase domain-containing protein [Anaerolineales bacterium]|nr:methyltransferase domain-containing protein [Anaerolineales bacterium]
MDDNRALTPKSIYELIAEVGFRRHFHFGGMQATEALISSCPIHEESTVLDVGCASGKTACYLAKHYGCRVTGVDLLEKMIDRANERAIREGVTDLVQFRPADAQELPFDDAIFDVVIGEFITGLLPDKRKGLKEYVRVTRTGGTIGLNEATWIQTPPPEDLVEYLSRTYGFQGAILTSREWEGLLRDVGLADLVVETYKVEALGSTWEGLMDVLAVWPRFLRLVFKEARFRQFLKETISIPKDLLEYFGYGLYVGWKAGFS